MKMKRQRLMTKAERKWQLAEAWQMVLARAAVRRQMVLKFQQEEVHTQRQFSIAGGRMAARDAMHRV